MKFRKIILGEDELSEFEALLIRDKIIERVHPDFSSYSDMIFSEAKVRINNKKRLLLSIMLFDKFDAVNMSKYDLTRLIDSGLIEEESSLVDGTDNNHPTSIVIDSAWQYKRKIIASIFKITEALFELVKIDAFPKALISEEKVLNACDAFLFGTQDDFLVEYKMILKNMLRELNGNEYVSNYINDYDTLLFIQEENVEYMMSVARKNINAIYSYLNKISFDEDLMSLYFNLCEELKSSVQTYSVPIACSTCLNNWETCCINSEFEYLCGFNCTNRSRLGSQRYAKFNGLILSSENNAVLFDNSLKFGERKSSGIKVIEDVYHIVNIDLSDQIGSLPVPKNVEEALRIRNRPEITSFRNTLAQWGDCLLNGNVNESEYIKKDFEKARAYFEKKESKNRKQCSIFHCFFEALGNQIPYLSNVAGIIAPFYARKKIKIEEQHRWFLLTR